jgi:hypothetical protein
VRSYWNLLVLTGCRFELGELKHEQGEPLLPVTPAAADILGGALVPVFGAFCVPILLLAVFFHYLPDITRRDIFFSVTVQSLFRDTPEARQTVRRFRVSVWIHSLIALGVAATGLAVWNPLIALGGIAWQVAGVTHAFLRARRETMPHSASHAVHAEGAPAPRPSGGVVHALLQIGPFGVLGAAALYLQTHWDSIPARFPVHWGHGWTAKRLVHALGQRCLRAAADCIRYLRNA